MSNLDLKLQVEILDREMDEAQRMIDHARKTPAMLVPGFRAALDRRQCTLDVQRIKLKAAKEYLANQE